MLTSEATGEVTVHTSRSLMDARGSDAAHGMAALSSNEGKDGCDVSQNRRRAGAARANVCGVESRGEVAQVEVGRSVLGLVRARSNVPQPHRILFIKTDTARREHTE